MNPLLASMLSEEWAMEPSSLERFLATVGDVDFSAASRLEAIPEDDGPGYELADGVATIPVSGTLMKSVPMLARLFGLQCSSYQDISRAISSAAADQSVNRIVLAFDSPGGSVNGVQSLADKIASTAKPVQAHVDGMCCSAAYWLASQAAEITATRGSRIGSIGAYVVLHDSSQAAAASGLKVHVIASGKNKGAGIPGAPITDEQLAEFRRGIDDIAATFKADVSRGRGQMPILIDEISDGRVYSANDALGRYLIDAITADHLKDYRMSQSIESMAAIAKDHPKHAALVIELAAADKSEEQIRAAIKERDSADAAAAAAAEVTALKARAEKAEADAKLAQESAEALKAENAKLAAAAAHVAGSVGAAIQPDASESGPKSITRAEYDRNPSQYARGLRERTIVLKD
jgi:capsid assembly protease